MLIDNSYTFMTIGLRKQNGERDDERYFLGRLPKEGEKVEMVFIGREKDSGDMRFQLRVSAQ